MTVAPTELARGLDSPAAAAGGDAGSQRAGGQAGGDFGPHSADWRPGPSVLDDRGENTPTVEWCGLVSPPAGGRGLPSPPRAWWRAVPPTDVRRREPPPVAERVIFDLCAGSGAWSEPYARAGYRVVRVTLPHGDVRTWVPPCRPWAVLAAPPCNEFSRAKRDERDYVAGMACVNACLRIVAQTNPVWWALENPQHGDLAGFIGPPQWTFQPYDFGDPWTKATGIWGEFSPPRDRRPVAPTGSAMDRGTPAARAVTPPGFAAAFFRENP